MTQLTNVESSPALLQFAATVPVPDNSATFLDIGTNTFSQSLYDDLGDININLDQFHNINNNHQHVQQQPQAQLQQHQQQTFAPIDVNALLAANPNASASALLPKPVSLEKLQQETTVETASLTCLQAPTVQIVGQQNPVQVLNNNIKLKNIY